MSFFKNIPNNLDWFLKKGKQHQVLITFILIIGGLVYERHQSKIYSQTKLNTYEIQSRRTDSVYDARLVNTTAYFRKELDTCSDRRIREIKKQIEQYRMLFERTDKYYQAHQKKLRE